jgi:antitoxin (DNA-binding transcriptional repressor) of toxin-antitoxin stability system
MGIFRIEEHEAEANFAAILTHIRRGDEIVLERPGAMVAAMPARAPQPTARGLLQRFFRRRPAPPSDEAMAQRPEALPAASPATEGATGPTAVTSKAAWQARR